MNAARTDTPASKDTTDTTAGPAASGPAADTPAASGPAPHGAAALGAAPLGTPPPAPGTAPRGPSGAARGSLPPGTGGVLSGEAEGLRWLLQAFVEEVPGVHSVAVVSSDGLLLLGSRRERPERFGHPERPGHPARPDGPGYPPRPGEARMDLAAVVSGLASLTVGAAKLMDGGRVRQTTVAMDDGMLLVTSISDGSLLGVHAAADCDVSVAGYHMARFVGRAGHVLTPALRSELRHATESGAAAVDADR